MPSFNLSPSRIARYFYHECERYLRYHATAKNSRKSSGIPDIKWDRSPVTKAILEGGFHWEEAVLRDHLNGRVRVAGGTGRLYERSHDIKESISHLKNLKLNESIYQPTLQVPDTFYERYGIDRDLCELPPCRPDLIFLTSDKKNRRGYRIVDIKGSSALKASHRVQVSLYTLILEEVLRDAGIKGQMNHDAGGVWTFGRNEPEWFELQFSTGVVRQFLRERLDGILTVPIEKVPWHLYFRCEWCGFFEACREEARETKSVTLLSNLSPGGRRYLRKASWDHEANPVNTLAEFKSLLIDDSAHKVLGACGSLKGMADRYINSILALESQEVIVHGGCSLALPKGEHVSIVITLQEEPVSGRIYAAGFRRFKGNDVYGNAKRVVCHIAETPDDCSRVKSDFIHSLYKEMLALHEYNQGKGWDSQKTLQIYVYDSYEFTLFNRLLQEAVKDRELSSSAVQLLFYFQSTILSEEKEHPDGQVPFPVVIITKVIRNLLALPNPLSLRLPEVSKVLHPPKFDFTINPNSFYWFELSNRLKSDAIFHVWSLKKKHHIEWLEKEISNRLTATLSVVGGIREVAGNYLFAWPKKFRFPGMLGFRNSELSRIAFVVIYESFMGALNARETRTAAWSERVRDAVSIPLELAEDDRWKVLSNVDVTALHTRNGFKGFLLVPDGEEGEQAQMSYDDFNYRKSMCSPGKNLWYAGINKVEADEENGLITHLELILENSYPRNRVIPGKRAVLHPRFTDFTSDRILHRLKEIDLRPQDDFLKLILDPGMFASPIQSDAIPSLEISKRHAKFTTSQTQAFSHFLQNRLTLVWGPPGTGKTHFLAKTILCLARNAKNAGKTVRIALTAFTHAAIENLLQEIRENIGDFGLDNELSLYKMKVVNTQRGEGLTVIDERSLRSKLNKKLLVVGGTVYSFFKSGVQGDIPVLIVDEASQMKFGELALALKSLGAGGRLLLAGDDLQLPPIIKGDYPDREDGLPGLHDSVFAYIRARDKGASPYTCQLKENWRMNCTLSHFPAHTLYGKDYKPVNHDVGNQKIMMKRGVHKEKDDKAKLCDWLLAPDYPLVVCILENIQATAENKVEAQLVATLSAHLRQYMEAPATSAPWPENKIGDKDFWRKGLFIVSPHHVQIRAIRKELSKLRKWNSSPFVDTVDKMQGQQCQAVIVSYGVSDAETAMAEAEFIYSLNRLNVSITRAHSKCIVFLPRPLLEPSFDLLQNEKAIKGLGHMHALVEYCRKNGSEERFIIDNLTSNGVLRSIRVRRK